VDILITIGIGTGIYIVIGMPISLNIPIGILPHMGAGSKSKLVRANPRTTSLQAVVPKGVIEQMGFKDGDILDWEISFLEGKKALIVRKA
jgi:hypothetical protein